MPLKIYRINRKDFVHVLLWIPLGFTKYPTHYALHQNKNIKRPLILSFSIQKPRKGRGCLNLHIFQSCLYKWTLK